MFNNQLVNKLSILDIQEKEMFRNMLESHIDYYYNKDEEDNDSIIHVLNKELTKYFKTNKDN